MKECKSCVKLNKEKQALEFSLANSTKLYHQELKKLNNVIELMAKEYEPLEPENYKEMIIKRVIKKMEKE